VSDLLVDGLQYPVIVSARASDAVIASMQPSSAIAIVYDARAVRSARALIARAREARTHVLGALALHGGERVKNARVVQSLWRWLLSRRADRESVLVAIGGGTVTDTAGFAAATFMRGIAWIAVPTTLLGMVDAAIGGKTAIDLPEGKNVAGAFWAPRAVVADVAALATLPRPELENGIAEIIKAAVIGDPSLLEKADAVCSAGLLSRARPCSPALLSAVAGATYEGAWAEVVAAAARVKAGIVARDPLESGERESLNLGHTLGHAIEHASRGRLAHGRAVAIGLRGEGLLAIALGLFSREEHARVLACLRRAGLPLHAPRLDVPAAMRALRADKKRRGTTLRFTLPAGIGEVRTGIAVEAATARRALAQCAAQPSAEELEV